MKKVLVSLIAVISIFFLTTPVSAVEKPKVTDHEKVNIYIFWGNGCGNCSNALTYFHELSGEYDDYFEVQTYEVWNNSENLGFAEEVAEKLDHELKGVPFIVVGDEYISGWGGSAGTQLIELALDFYQDKNYKDIVANQAKITEHEITKTSLIDAFQLDHAGDNNHQDTPSNNANTSNSGGKYDGIIIAAIFVVLIGGCAGLVVLGKK